MKRILVCGPLPPPIGGVSIHIARLISLLENEGFHVAICDESSIRNDDVFNIRSLSLIKYIRLVKNCDIVHIHSSVSLFRLVHLLFSFFFRKKIIVTIHSWRVGGANSFFWRKILNLVADKVVVVSEDIKQKISIDESMIEVQPAFIPPQSHSSEIPLDILDFICKARDAHKKIIVSNAFRLAQHNGQDLYGLDLCVEAFSNMEISSRAVLIFIISDPEYNYAQIEKIMVSIKSQRLESCVLIYRGAIDFFNLLQHADVSVRATNTDGDALSVRESIYLGVPCISSDCVKRPKEAILFNNRSAKSLTDKIVKTITIKKDSNTFDTTNYFDVYRKIYLGK